MSKVFIDYREKVLEWIKIIDTKKNFEDITIENIGNFRTLFLERNNIKYVSQYINSLTNLHSIYLKSNHLQDLPQSLSELKLKIIDISYNLFDHMPKVLFGIETLKKINCGSNNIREIPKNILKLKQLEFFDISCNLLNKAPLFINDLPSLKELRIINQNHNFSKWLKSKEAHDFVKDINENTKLDRKMITVGGKVLTEELYNIYSYFFLFSIFIIFIIFAGFISFLNNDNFFWSYLSLFCVFILIIIWFFVLHRCYHFTFIFNP